MRWIFVLAEFMMTNLFAENLNPTFGVKWLYFLTAEPQVRPTGPSDQVFTSVVLWVSAASPTSTWNMEQKIWISTLLDHWTCNGVHTSVFVLPWIRHDGHTHIDASCPHMTESSTQLCNPIIPTETEMPPPPRNAPRPDENIPVTHLRRMLWRTLVGRASTVSWAWIGPEYRCRLI